MKISELCMLLIKSTHTKTQPIYSEINTLKSNLGWIKQEWKLNKSCLQFSWLSSVHDQMSQESKELISSACHMNRKSCWLWPRFKSHKSAQELSVKQEWEFELLLTLFLFHLTLSNYMIVNSTLKGNVNKFQLSATNFGVKILIKATRLVKLPLFELEAARYLNPWTETQ